MIVRMKVEAKNESEKKVRKMRRVLYLKQVDRTLKRYLIRVLVKFDFLFASLEGHSRVEDREMVMKIVMVRRSTASAVPVPVLTPGRKHKYVPV